MISVVVPLYNKEQQIASTLDTVRAQTFTEYEVVIVNDGSKDHSAQVVTEYAATYPDFPLRLIHQENAGVSAARNKGIAEAAYDYIAFLDADDLWEEAHLQVLASLASTYPHCGVCATAYVFEEQHGQGQEPMLLRRSPFADPSARQGVLMDYFALAACSHPPIWTGAVMARRQLLQQVGGFPEGVSSGEDLLTWARLAVRTQIAYSLDPSAIYQLDDYGRPHDERDMVGQGLLQLYADCTEACRGSLAQYIALWFKMRAMVSMRHGYRATALRFTFRALRMHPSNPRLYLLLLFCLQPRFLQKAVQRFKP